MTEELFRDFWWIIFPIFGMAMAWGGMASSERKSAKVLDLIRSYTDRGKEPPPELVSLAAKNLSEDDDASPTRTPAQLSLRSFFFFAGLAAGFAVAYALTRATEDWSWVFIAAAVAFAVIAFGALVQLFVGRK